MRVNVYSQELIAEVEEQVVVSDSGIPYYAARLYLHSSPMLHHSAGDDDRSAVTFWLPKSRERRLEMAGSFRQIASIFEYEPEEENDQRPQTPSDT